LTGITLTLVVHTVWCSALQYLDFTQMKTFVPVTEILLHPTQNSTHTANQPRNNISE